MATALTPADLVRDAEYALTAARAAATFLAAHPDLPIERMHASGIDQDDNAGPLLEIQLGNNVGALTEFSESVSAEVEKPSEIEFRIVLKEGDVTVLVTAWEFSDEPADF